MKPRTRILGVLVALLLTTLIAAGSRVPVAFSRDDAALLRLSWRLPGIALEDCRTLSREELDRLPIHMRNPQACIGVIAPYVLEVTLDGALLARDTVMPAGARGDRPLNVLREFPLAPGEHRLNVTFRAILPGDAIRSGEGVAELVWEGPVQAGPRDVRLVALDATGRALALR